MKFKKIIILTLVIASVIPNLVNASEIPYYVNNNAIEMTEEDYNNLKNLGFTDYEIQNMGQKEFENNHDIIGVIVSENIKYYRTITNYSLDARIICASIYNITEQEYTSENTSEIVIPQGNGYVETNYKKVTTQIIAVAGKYRYKTSVEWKSIPSTRSYDIIGIGIDTSVYIYSGITFQQNYCYSNGICSSSNTSTIKNSSTGGAALFKLPASSSITTMSSYIYFTIDKSSSTTISELYAYGDYSHATTTTYSSYSSKYTINKAGINLDSSIINSYDAIPVSKASWIGSW